MPAISKSSLASLLPLFFPSLLSRSMFLVVNMSSLRSAAVHIFSRGKNCKYPACHRQLHHPASHALALCIVAPVPMANLLARKVRPLVTKERLVCKTGMSQTYTMCASRTSDSCSVGMLVTRVRASSNSRTEPTRSPSRRATLF